MKYLQLEEIKKQKPGGVSRLKLGFRLILIAILCALAIYYTPVGRFIQTLIGGI